MQNYDEANANGTLSFALPLRPRRNDENEARKSWFLFMGLFVGSYCTIKSHFFQFSLMHHVHTLLNKSIGNRNHHRIAFQYNRRMQRSSSYLYYLSVLVVVLWVASSGIASFGVTGLHQQHQQASRAGGSRCYSPRPVTSVKTEYRRNRVDVEHEYLQVPLLLRSRPYYGEATKDAAETLQIASYSPPAILATSIVSSNDSNNTIKAENDSKKNIETSSKSTATEAPPLAVINLGCILAMNGGFLNGLGLSGILGGVSSVAAVTGTYTTSAVAFSSTLDPTALFAVLFTTVCYMLGSFVNGVLNPEGAPMDVLHLSWIQSSPLLLAGCIMILLEAHTGGPAAAATFSVPTTFCLLAFVLGLQNSFTSHLLSGNLLRTSHMSGMTSDIGSILGQMARGNTENAYKLPIFAKLTASFWAGGMLSVLGTKYIHSMGAGSVDCTMSALLYLGLWTIWTEPLRRGISTTTSPVTSVKTDVGRNQVVDVLAENDCVLAPPLMEIRPYSYGETNTVSWNEGNSIANIQTENISNSYTKKNCIETSTSTTAELAPSLSTSPSSPRPATTTPTVAKFFGRFSTGGTTSPLTGALLSFGWMWTAWTEHLRRGISARLSQHKRVLYAALYKQVVRRHRQHHHDGSGELSSSSSSSRVVQYLWKANQARRRRRLQQQQQQQQRQARQATAAS